MAKVDLLVTVEGQRQVDEMAKSLQNKGLEVRKTYPRSGTIIGTGDSSLLESLKGVEGVEAIRQEGSYQLPPMDDKTPQ
jgi:hypothetical protein